MRERKQTMSEPQNKSRFSILRDYYIYFMMYAIVGWIYEVFLEVVVYGWGFTNRGVLFGCYCPVYGFGALLIISVFYRFVKGASVSKRILLLPLMFIGCTLTATAVELVASYLCEAFTGSWPWQTYSSYRYNFQARIALSPSIRFGIGASAVLYLAQPAAEKLLQKCKTSLKNRAAAFMAVVFGADILWLILKIFID